MADEKNIDPQPEGTGGEAPAEDPVRLDPGAMRDMDTSRLKRIKPQATGAAKSTSGDEPDFTTETVHLKVIKENRKKDLSGLLSASQTIRLRPATQGADAAAPTSKSKAVGRKTLKLTPISDPDAPAPVAEPAADDGEGSASEVQTRRLSLKKKAATPGAPTIVSPPVGAPATVETSAAPQTESGDAVPAAGKSKPTLKLRAPTADAADAAAAGPAEPPAAGERPTKKTLKLKAPVAGADTAASVPAAAVAAADRPKTLKLKSSKSAATERAPAPPSPAPDGEAAQQPLAMEPIVDTAVSEEGAEPGIVYTLSAVASLVLFAAATFFMVSQYLALMK